MQRVTGETLLPSGFVSARLNSVFIVFSVPLYQSCPALWSREHTHTVSLEAVVVIVILCACARACVSGSFTPWTLLKGLIQRNPIRLSSFPQTAILVLLAQTARYSIRDAL